MVVWKAARQRRLPTGQNLRCEGSYRFLVGGQPEWHGGAINEIEELFRIRYINHEAEDWVDKVGFGTL